MNKPAPPVLHDLIDAEEELLTKMLQARTESPIFIALSLGSIVQYTFIIALGIVVCKLFFN